MTPESLTERDRRIDRKNREIAQEAKLDADLAAAPPRWRGSSVIVAVLVIVTLGLIAVSILP